MKRILCMALCVMMVMSLLAGCGGNTQGSQPVGSTPAPTTKHTHEWSWATNETSHWKACSGCDLQANMGAHMYDNNDGVCADCGYVEPCEHTFDEEKWMSNAEKHWHPATCKHEGLKGSEADHVDEDNDGVCDVCEYFDETHEHTYKPEWSTDENEHWHDADCGHTLTSDKEAHVDLENDGVCDTCLWFDETHTHTFEENWTTDAANHWYASTCQHTGAVDQLTRHADEDVDGYCDTCNYLMCTHADFDVDGICDICGYEDPDHTHEYVAEYAYDYNGHWKIGVCHPGAHTQVESHVDRNNDGNCDVCQFVICSHTYKKTWSSDETHHWYQLTCTCSIETRKDYGEHVDADGVNGCDVCLHGYQAPSPVTVVMDKVVLSIDPRNSMITWTEMTINIPKPGRYLITSDNMEVRWYTDKNQENKPTSYASEIYFEEAGEVTLLAYYFDFNFKTAEPFEIHVTMTCVEDLVLNTSRGKAELPTMMNYKVVFEAMEVGIWTLTTSLDAVCMGVTEDDLQFTHTVEVVVEKAGDLVELWVFREDEMNSTFIFDWELQEPFQLDVGVGQSPISVPAIGDDYKVVFTAPEDGQFLLSVSNDYLTFSEWGLFGHNAPVRTESTQQLTPAMKAGETFTTWIQPVYNYVESTNINDTLTIINVGTMLEIGESLISQESMLSITDLLKVQSFQATDKDGTLTLSVTNGKIGVKDENGDLQWIDATGAEGQKVSLLSKDMVKGEILNYYVSILDVTKEVQITTNYAETAKTTTLTLKDLVTSFSYTVKDNGEFTLSLTGGMIGVEDTQGQIKWMDSELRSTMRRGQKVTYYVMPENEKAEVRSVLKFQRLVPISEGGVRYSFQAEESTYYSITVVNGELGITTNGVTQWVAPKTQNGKNAATYEVKVEKGETYVFQIRGTSGETDVEVLPVRYVIDLNEMFNAEGETLEEMGKTYTANMVPSKLYDLTIPDSMLKLRVKLDWDYKGVTVYVNGEVYKMGSDLYLQDVNSITAKLQNNENKDVNFTLTVVYSPEKVEAPTEADIILNADMKYQVVAGGQALAHFKADMGGTYTLTCNTPEAVIYVENELGQKGDVVINGNGTYTFQLNAGEEITFIIEAINSEAVTAQITLTQGTGK